MSERPSGPNRGAATTRLRRLLAMVPWLAANDGPTVDEVCARFGITTAELQADLDLLTLYVGVPPYTPDQFFEMTIEGGRVFARVTPSLDRPLRLTPAEGLALVVAGRALVADDHDPDDPDAEGGALARGLDKIAGLLRHRPRRGRRHRPRAGRRHDARPAPARRRRQGRQVEIDHYGEARDERQRRVVDPWRVARRGR